MSSTADKDRAAWAASRRDAVDRVLKRPIKAHKPPVQPTTNTRVATAPVKLPSQPTSASRTKPIGIKDVVDKFVADDNQELLKFLAKNKIPVKTEKAFNMNTVARLGPTMRARRRPRRRRLRARVNRNPTVGQRLIRTITPMGQPTNQRVAPIMRGRQRLIPPNIVTRAEENFLKAAFAPIDFQELALDGVPDTYSGPSIVRQETYLSTVTVPANSYTILLVPPIPGVAYASANNSTGVVGGATDFECVNYGSYQTLFGAYTTPETANVLAFRFMGTMIELQPASPVTTNSGVLMVSKQGITVTTDGLLASTTANLTPLTTGALSPTIDLTTCSVTAVTTGPVYNRHPNDGCYAIGYNQGDWSFTPIWDDVASIPVAQAYFATGADPPVISLTNVKTDLGQITAASSQAIPGWGKHQSIVVILQNTASSPLVMSIQTRQIVEYIPNAKSILYSMATPSPAPNIRVLQMYSYAVHQLAIAVPYTQNAGFWATLLSIWRGALSIASIIPGPISAVATGLRYATNALVGTERVVQHPELD